MNVIHRYTRTVLITLAASAAGCATADLPKNLPNAKEAILSGKGAWAVVTCDSQKYRGELIAVSGDSLFLIVGPVLAAIPRLQITEAKLFIVDYPVSGSGITTWTIFGVASTLSHGVGLVMTAPLWLIVSAAAGPAAASDADDGDLRYPGTSISRFSEFARFPRGLPQGIDRARLGGVTPTGP